MNVFTSIIGRGFLGRVDHLTCQPAWSIGLVLLLLHSTHVIQQFHNFVDTRSPHGNALAVAFAATSLAIAECSCDHSPTYCTPPTKTKKGKLRHKRGNQISCDTHQMPRGKIKGEAKLNLLDPSNRAFNFVGVLLLLFVEFYYFYPQYFLTDHLSSPLQA